VIIHDDDWGKIRLKHISKSIGQYGANISAGNYLENGVRFLRTTDIQENGELITSEKGAYVDKSLVQDYLLQPDDILFSRSGTLGRSYLHQNNTISDFAFAGYLVRFRLNHLVHPKFIFYVSKSSEFSAQIEADAIQSTISNFNGEKYGNIGILIPTLETQKLIASFLDRKTATIDTLIAKKQRLIQILEEKRTDLIDRAVTKGLNPNAPMKESGIPSIGKIPEHWEIARLKWKITYVDQGRSPVCANRLADDGEWGVLKVGCVNGGVFNELEHKAFPEDLLKDFEHDIYKFKIHPGDILVSRANTKELVGSAARVGSIQSKLMLCDKLYRLHLSGKVDPEFLILILNSRLARCQFEQESSGASGSMQNISHDKLSNLLLPFPPNQTEQVKINTVFQERSLVLQSSKLKLFEQIEKLQEYRRSLITAAVTGKLDIK
jgi:type I restriction enzyme, S subunit